MLKTTHLIGFGGSVPDIPVATRSYRTSLTTTSFVSPQTYLSVDIGTAADSRRVLVGIFNRGVGAGSSAITSVTIGGVTASILETASASADDKMWTFIAKVPTGTTANIVVTGSGLGGATAVMVYALYNLVFDDPTDTDKQTLVDPSSVNVDAYAGGVIVGFFYTVPQSTTVTWTNVTEDVDTVFDSNRTFSAGSAEFATAQTALAITADPASSGGTEALIVHAFR